MIELLDIRPKISVTDEYVLSEERKVKSIESEERRVKSEETTFGDRRESQFDSPEAQAQFNIQHSTLPNCNPNALIPFSRCGNGIDKPMQPDAGIKDGTL